MNLTFKTVWDENRQCWIAVQENTRARGKRSKSSRQIGDTATTSAKSVPSKSSAKSRRKVERPAVVLAAALLGFPSLSALAATLPEGGSLTYGQGQVTQSGNEMTITQSSAKMAIDWNSFNIGQGNKVIFVQPSSSSVAMNRVTGTDVSVIQGSLQANGQVFLSNPNGVLFTKDAQVNVGSLVATTLHMSNEDLASGRYRLQGKSDKSVINQGSITATSGDGKGGVALIAAKIINEGSITAERGTVALAAANKVTLDLGGPVKVQIEEGALNALIEQGGAVRADGGTVIMTAEGAGALMAAAINHKGLTMARTLATSENGKIQIGIAKKGNVSIEGKLDVSAAQGKAGAIEVTAENITLKTNASINANGASGGGTVLIGGDWQGSGTLTQAKKVKMEQGARIDASATLNGDGGKVVLWSDIKNTESITSVDGSINTLGAGNGKGGQVETSGHQLGVLGDVNAGRGGDWLLDPVDIWITESTGTDITSNTNVISSDEIIKASSISATLSNGANVTITTAQASSPTCISGTITVFDSITSNSSTPVSLNLLGNSSITLLAGVNITSTSGSLTVNLSPNLSNTGGNIILMGNNVIETKGGSVLFGTVSRRAQGLSNVDNNGLELRQGVSILTDGGDISLYGKSASTSGAGIFIQKNVTLNSGSGKIWIDGEAGSPTTNGSRGNGIVFFANAGTGAIGAFDANAAANINIISTNADNTNGWESNLNFASPITIKAATVNSINTTIPANSRFNTATGMLINWTGGGVNGSVNIYSPQGHAKWIADGGDLSISARAPVQLNANGAVVAWGAKTGTTLPDIGSTTSEFNLNVTQNLITSAAMNGMLSFLGTTSGVMVQNCGSGWIPTESQLQTRFNSTKLSLGDSTVNNMTLTDSVNMANNTLNINAKNTLWTTTNFSSSKTITNTGNVTLVADSVTLGDVWTIGGGLTIQPRTASASIGLGNTLGGLNITRATFQNLNVSSPTAAITIGRSDGTGDINFTDGSPLAWTGATTFITGTGNITLNTSSSTPGTSDINVNGSLALTTSGNIRLGGQIQTTANQTLSGDVVLLRDTTLLSTAGAINSPSNFSLTSGNLNINQALTSTLAGLISGTQAIAKSGAGTLILSGNNTYTGVTTINQGKLAIGAGGAGGELQSSSIINNGDLEFNSSADHIYAGIISGTGSLRKLGSGALTLNVTASDFSGDHGTYSSFTGNVFVDQGVLKLNNQQNVVSPTTSSIGNIAVSGRSITVNNTGILEFSQSHVLGNALTTPVILLTINSGGVVRNNNTFNTLGDIVLSGGTLSSNGGLSSTYQAFNLVGKIATSGGNVSSIGGTGLHGGFHLAANTFFTISDATGNDSPDITVSAALLDGVDNSGSKGLTKSGAGTMLLTGESTYTGSTSISAGTLIVGNGSNGSITGTSSIINNANLTFNRTTDITYNATFSGLSTANFTQAGTGALIWSGNGSAYAGNVRLNCGTLAINGNTGGIASIGTGTLFFNGGTLRYTSNYNADNSSKFSTAAGQLYRIDTNSEDVVFGTALTSSNGTLFKTGAGKLSLTAANTYTGTTTIAAGILSIGNGGTTGSIAAGSELVNCATLAFNLTNDVIFSRLISGSGNLSQIGSGRLILTANNTYTGNTTISAGSLVLGNNDVSGSILNTSSIINNSNLIFDRKNAVNFSQVISGSGNVSQNGTGVLTLTASNTYNGTTTVNNGSLVIGDGATNGSISNSSNIVDNANLTFNRSDALTLNKIISGTGNVTKSGTGNLTLTATNTYTGVTTIANGTLIVGDGGTNGSIDETSSIVDNGTLIFNRSDNITLSKAVTGNGSLTQAGSGILSLTAENTYGGVTRIEQGTLSIGAGGTTGSIANISNAINNGTLMFNRSNDVSLNAPISGIGNLTQAGTGNLTLRGNSTYTGNTTVTSGTMIVGDGATNGSIAASANIINNANLTFNRSDATNYTSNLSGNSTANLQQAGSGLLTFSGNGSTYLGNVTLTAGTVSLNASNAVGPSNGGVISFNGGTLQYTSNFNSDNSARFSTAINQQVKIDTNGQQITFATGLNSNGGSLTKLGSGNLTLVATNTYTGATTINAGTLIVGDGGTNGSISNTSSIVDNGTLIFNRSDNITIAGAINGTGSLTQNGTGIVSLTGTNTYSGVTTIERGTLSIGAGGTTGSIANISNVVNNGTLMFNRSDEVSLNAPISGVGNLTQAGTGNLTLRGNNIYTGNTTVSNGTMIVGDGAGNGSITSSANIINNANLSFNRSDAVNLSKAISGSGNVSQNGTGVLTLTASNTYNGTTTVNNGSLVIGDGATNGSIANSSNIVDNANLTFNRSDDITLNKVISGTGNVTKNGTGNLTLTATNTYQGVTTIANGTLIVGDGGTNGSIDATSSIVDNGTLIFNRSDNITLSKAVNGTGSLTQAGAGILSLTAENTYSGVTRIEQGTLSIGAGGTTGSIANISNAVNNGTLMFNRSDDVSLNAPISGVGNLTQAGTGNLTLRGNSTYTGNTTVSSGTMIVGDGATNGSIATSANIINNANLTFNRSDTTNYTSNLSGNSTANLQQAGSGLLTFSGNGSTYLGNVTLTAGTVSLNASNAVGPTNGGVISFNGGTLQYTSNFNSDNSARFSTAINQQVKIDTNGQQITFATGLNSNGGSLTKLGSGNLTLVATNTYTGATTINAGTLIVGDGGTNGTIDATSSIVDNGTLIFNHSGPVVLAKVISGTGNLTQAGAGSLKLTATNTYTGATTINAGTLIIGDGATNGSIATTSGIVDNGTLIFDRSDALTQAGAITGTGHVTQNGTGSVTLTGTNTYDGLTTINNGTLVVGDGGTNGSISNTTGIVDNGTLVFNRSDSNTLSKIISGSGNLSQNGSGVLTLTATNTYSGITTVNNGSLVIGDGGTNGSIANSSNIVDNANLSFNRSDDITLNKVISGTGHVTKSGAGNLTLTATNTYTGATTINAGTLIVGDGGTNGSIATTSAIVDNGTLIFNRTDPVVLAKAISGTGNLTQAGSGSLQLTATNTYTGATNISSGTLIIGDGATNGSIANTSGIVDNGTLIFNRSNALIQAGAISGTGHVIQNGTGSVTLTGENTYGGLTTINNGSLVVGDGGTNGSISNTSGIVDNGTLIFNRSDNITLAKVISGSGNLSQNGTGVLSLTATNTYAGTTTIERGTLSIGAGGTTGSIENIANVVNNGTLMFNHSDDINLNAAISGSGNLTQAGTGVLTLKANNTYTGNTTISNGTLVVGDGLGNGSIATTNAIVDNGILKFNRNDSITVAQVISGSGQVIQDGNGTGVLTFTKNNTYTGATTITSGTMIVGDGLGNGSIATSSGIVDNGTLKFNRNDSITVAQVISGSGQVIQDGNGTGVLTLTKTNTYTGATTITTGTLVVGDGGTNGSIATTSSIIDNGTLKFNRNDSITVAQVISGTGQVIQNGNGTGALTLTKNNTYTGATTITSGTLVVGDGLGNGSIATTSAIVDNGTLKFNRNDAISLDKVISGTGNLIQDGNGTGVLTLTKNNTYTGATTISSGTLVVGDGGTNGSVATTSAIVDNGTLKFNRNDAIVLGKEISGSGQVIQDGNGTGVLTLTANSTYTGNTTVTSGTMIVGDGATNGSITTSANIINNANLTFNRSDATNYTSNLSGNSTANLQQAGSGLLTFSGNGSAYLGNVTLTAGTVSLNASNAVGPTNGGVISFNGGTLQYTSNFNSDNSARFSTANNQQVKIDTNGQQVTFATGLNSNGGSLTKLGSGNLTLVSTNTYTGATTINAGTLIVGDGGTNGTIDATSSIVDNGTLIFNHSGPVVLAKVISGTGNLTQAGAGSLKLTATNTYTGATTINAGTLIIGDGATNGSITNTSGIFDNGILIFDRSDALTQAGAITGTGHVTQNGTGSVTLTGTNTYTGQTTINSGTLVVGDGLGNGSIDTSSAIVDNGILKFNRNDSITVAQVISGSGQVIQDGNGSGVLTLTKDNTYTGQTTITSGGMIVGDGATNGSIFSSSDIVNNANLTFNRSDATEYTGNFSGNSTASLTKTGAGVFSMSGNGTGYLGTVNLAAGTLSLNASTAIDAAAIGTISMNGGVLQYTSQFTNDLSAKFSHAGNQQYKIDTGTQSIRFTSALDSNNGELTKLGTGNLTLTATNTYTGATTINAGTLIVGDGLGNGSIATTSSIVDNDTLKFNRNDTISLDQVISGTGQVIQDGNGTGILTLTKNNTYAGATTITSGTMVVGDGAANGSISASSAIVDNGTLKFNRNDSITVAQVISGSGQVIQDGNGTGVLTLTKNNTYTGQTTITSGTLVVGDGGTNGSIATTSSIVDNGTLKFNRNDTISLDKVISGSGQVIQDGNGTGILTLTANNTYTGQTTIASGTLVVGDGGINGSIATTSDIVDNGTLKFNRNDTITLAKEISGTGQVIQDGNGTGVLTLTANNTFTGNTTIASGTLVVGDGLGNGSISTTSDIVDNGTLKFNRNDTISFDKVISGTGQVIQDGNGTGVLTLTKNNTYTGQTTITSGTMVVGDGAANGSISTTSAIVDNSTLKFNRNDTISLDQVISGTGQVIQEGNGTGVLTLTKENTYTGATMISSGTLVIGDGLGNGSISTTSAIVDNGTLKFNRNDTISLDKVISGTGQVIQDGNGTGVLTLTANNTYTGQTTISSGTLVVGDGLGNGSIAATSAIVDNGTLKFNRNDTISLDQIISGTGQVIQDGNGTGVLTLTGTNTYTGQTTINSGTLVVGDGLGNGSIDTSSAIVDNGILKFNRNDSITVAQVISGSGQVIQDGNGSGVLTLTKDNTYTGQTTITSGGMIVGDGATNGSIFSSTDIVNNANLTFNRSDATEYIGNLSGNSTASLTKTGAGVFSMSGNGTGYLGTVNLAAGTLSLNASTAIDAAAIGTISLNGGILQYTSQFTNDLSAKFSHAGNQQYKIDTGTQSIRFSSALDSNNGELTKLGSGNLTLTATNTYTGATVINAGTLIVGDGLGNGSIATTSAIVDNGILKFNRNDTISLDKVISGTGQVIQDGNGTGVLTLTKNNTYTGQTTITSGTMVVGDGAANGSISTTSAIIDNGTLKFNRHDTITLAKEISGSGQVIQDGNGTGVLNLTKNNTYTGQTTITSGTLVVGDGGTNGSIATTSNIVDNGTLKFNRNGTIALDKVISGTGQVIQDGNVTGVLTLTANNTYTGQTTISSGSLVVGDGGVNGSIANTSAIVDNGTLKFNRNDTITLAKEISGTGQVIQDGNGTGVLTLTANNTFTGNTTIASGTLVVGDGLGNGSIATTNAIVDNGTLKFNRNDTISLDKVISGTGQVIQDGNGTGVLTLTKNNTYTGQTTISSGTLIVGDGAASGSISTTSAIVDNGTLILNRSGNVSLLAQISGAGNLTQAGSGNLTLLSNNTYTGNTTISSGSMIVGDGASNGSIFSSRNIINNANLSFNRSDAIEFAGNLSGSSTLANLNQNGSGTLTLSNNGSSYAGGISLNNGTVQVNAALALGPTTNVSTGMISFNGGALKFADGITTDYSLRFSSVANQTFNIDTGNQSLSLAGNLDSNGGVLTKSGNGTLTLTGNTTYTGLTTIDGGKLVVGDGGSNGALGNTSGIVNNGELSFNLNTTVNLDKEISGTGSFTQQGNGTVVLTKNNTYSGVTTISNGTLVVGNGTAEGSLGNTSNIVNNGSLAFNLNATVNLDKVISGNGALTQQGSGSLQLTADNNYSGVTTISSGSLVIGDGGSNGSITSTANVVNNGNLSFNRADEVVFNKAISGSGNFEQQGNGTLVLSTNNSYAGLTTISNGTLVVGNGGNTGSLGSTTGVVNNGSLIFKRANEYAFSNVISGNGSLDQQGNGTLTLSAVNTYAGVTNVSSGELIVTNAQALGGVAAGTVVNGGSLVISGGIALANEAITLNGTGTSGAGALASRAGSNTVTGEVTLSGNASINAASNSGLNITGAINGNKELAAAGGGNFSFAKIGNATAVAGINITAAAAVGFADVVTSSDNISVVANSSVSLNGTMTATGSMVRFDTAGTVTQTNSGNIVADRLALKGSGGNHTLTAVTNNVSTLAADTGSFAYVNAGNLTIGVVNPEGVNATGPVSITTLTGNLVVSENITTTDTSLNALMLNAGINSVAGNATGGDIVLNGAAITVGSGGRASFYTGSVAGTTALAAAIGSSTGNFRYNSDETTTNFTLDISTGSYVIYREQPTVHITALDARKMYDRQAWTGGKGYSCNTCLNGDSFYTMVNYTGSSQGAINVGNYAITPDGNLMSRLGYAIGSLTSGTLFITPEFDAGTAGKINKDDSAGKSDKSLNPGLLFVKVDRNLQPTEPVAEVASNAAMIQDLKILLVNGGLKEEKVPFISSSKKISRR